MLRIWARRCVESLFTTKNVIHCAVQVKKKLDFVLTFAIHSGDGDNAAGVKSKKGQRKMPFAYGPYTFNEVGISGIQATGGVYGLAKPSPNQLGFYTILYVGKTGNLPERLRAHLNNPPVSGITHFFAEALNGDAARSQREAALIAEFNPVGNTQLK
jgi:hypothetical protein